MLIFNNRTDDDDDGEVSFEIQINSSLVSSILNFYVA